MDERRGTPRATVALGCTLRRARGGPVSARTVDLGPGGMKIRADRPLTLDEVLDFDLPLPPAGARHVDGRARVLRLQGPEVYALRFERLADPARAELRTLADELSRRPGAASG
jgi:hypothetical protein